MDIYTNILKGVQKQETMPRDALPRKLVLVHVIHVQLKS